ncbi:MAG: hypothetical protein J5510_07585 [Prevotella sp.]|nr:hypothetical protein [Prevotella sp.]
MKKIMCFIALFLYIMGTIGGIGYCLYNKAYVIAIAVAVLSVMAFPTVRNMFKYLTD